MADLGVGEEVFEQVIGALQIGALLDQHPANAVHLDARLDDGQNGLVLSSIRDHDHSRRLEACYQILQLGGQFAVRYQADLEIPCQRGYLRRFTRGRQLVQCFDASEDGVGIRVLRIGHGQLQGSIDVSATTNDRALDPCLAAQIVVAIDAEHEDVHKILFEKKILK